MYCKGTYGANEALGLIVEYWFREIVEKMEYDQVHLVITDDGEIKVIEPSFVSTEQYLVDRGKDLNRNQQRRIKMKTTKSKMMNDEKKAFAESYQNATGYHNVETVIEIITRYEEEDEDVLCGDYYEASGVIDALIIWDKAKEFALRSNW